MAEQFCTRYSHGNHSCTAQDYKCFKWLYKNKRVHFVNKCYFKSLSIAAHFWKTTSFVAPKGIAVAIDLICQHIFNIVLNSNNRLRVDI